MQLMSERGILRQLQSGFFQATWHQKVERDSSRHRPFPFVDDLAIRQGIFGFDFGHPFHRVATGADVPPDDVADLLWARPGILIDTGFDRDLADKRLGPALSDQAHDLVVDRFDAMFAKKVMTASMMPDLSSLVRAIRWWRRSSSHFKQVPLRTSVNLLAP